MKKQRLFLAIIAVTAAVFAFRWNTPQSVPSVNTVVLEKETVEQTVTCNGVIEAGEITGVFPTLSCVVKEVHVTKNQAVKKGDVLVTIDKDATKAIQNDRVTDALGLLTMPMNILAPTDGVVLSVEIPEDGVLHEALPCVTMAAQEDLQVRVLIREKLLPRLAEGQEVRVSGVGFDKAVYSGVLQEISSSANTDSSGAERVVEGIVTLGEGQADASMRLGLSAKAKIVVSITKEGVLIPYESVLQRGDDDRFVYFLEDSHAVSCVITALAELPSGILVEAESFAGKTLILQPEMVKGDGMLLRGA